MLTLRLATKIIQLQIPEPGTRSVEVPGETCSSCSKDLVIRGEDCRIGGHDYFISAAYCVACGAYAGALRLHVATIFGLEEDERVLNGRWRVY